MYQRVSICREIVKEQIHEKSFSQLTAERASPGVARGSIGGFGKSEGRDLMTRPRCIGGKLCDSTEVQSVEAQRANVTRIGGEGGGSFSGSDLDTRLVVILTT